MITEKSLAFPLAVLGLCAAAAPGAQEGANSVPRKTQTPFTYLFDTRAASSAALTAEALTGRAGWTVVAENDVSHAFAGDAVFLNDKLAVVLRGKGPGAEVYSKTASGVKQRALLAPCAAAGDRATGLSAVKIIENSPAAVMLDAAFRTEAGKSASVRVRLTAGVMFLETRPGQGASRLLIRDGARYVVVPELFGNDMVFGADGSGVPRVGLPAENCLLSLADGGNAIGVCVWQSNEQNAEVIFAEDGSNRVIGGYEIECMKGRNIWLAMLEGPGIWHGRAIADKEVGTDIVLDWRPPFPAKWRCSFVRSRGVAESWDFRDKRDIDNSAGGSGEDASPCWFQSSRALLRVPRQRQPGGSRRVAEKHPRRLVVYPIDRSRSTPLTVFCLIDIMRNTLGVGVCQYILEMEGLGSETPATPDHVTRWVEKQFQRKREKRASAAIKDRLGQMIRHIERAESRIREYGDFARRLRPACVNAEKNEDTSDAARRLLEIADDMERSIALRRKAAQTLSSAEQLSGRIVALIGKANGLAECQRLGSRIRSVGAAQGKTLAGCRMAVRRMKQQCRMAAAGRRRAADFARKVQSQAEQMLRRK